MFVKANIEFWPFEELICDESQFTVKAARMNFWLREGEKVSVGVDIHRGDRFSDTQRVIVFVYREVSSLSVFLCMFVLFP